MGDGNSETLQALLDGTFSNVLERICAGQILTLKPKPSDIQH
jgi:hypothetical protein